MAAGEEDPRPLGGGGGGGGLYRPSSFHTIGDSFTSLPDVTRALRRAGLESCNLIVGIDFTKSNTWTGERTFGNKCLHDLSEQNPYQRVIRVIGKTLSDFDEDGEIPVFGFGSQETKDKSVFALHTGDACNGFDEVLERYAATAATVKLSGPTSFAPLIRKAIEIVKDTSSFHVLLIVADGQVDKKEETIAAIIEASKHPLAIVMVGVGDGPWEAMKEFDDAIPERDFDNFQFVNFTALYEAHRHDTTRMETSFALAALQELPEQFADLKRLGYL